jgi:hypothetical protein
MNMNPKIVKKVSPRQTLLQMKVGETIIYHLR